MKQEIEQIRLDMLAAECASAVAPVFADAGWSGWPAEAEPLNAAQIAVALRRLMGDVEMDGNLPWGRLHVSRYVDERGDETFEVTLHVGSVTHLGD